MVKLALPQRAGLDALVAALGGPEATRLIGGVVRDGLLGLPVSDIDIATRLTPDVVMARLDAAAIRAVPTGLAHGTVTAVLPDGPIEVTTLRRDVATDGRHATVAFTDDWQADAARRDFTINTLYADPISGVVFDYFEGIADLKAGRVRFIGDPLTRIAEDHLRILRFFRFYARYGRGEPDADALAACTARANDLMALSRERIAGELLKLLGSAAPVNAVRVMIAHDILKPVLPEITTADTLEHLVAREAEAGLAGDAIRRLAALIGPSPERAAAIAARLKLSNAQGRRLSAACGWERHDGSAQALAYALGTESAVDRLLIGRAPLDEVIRIGAWQKPVLPISGGALVARGLRAGPIVAATLTRIEAEWVSAGFPEGAAFEAIVDRALSAALQSESDFRANASASSADKGRA